jgi:hypothetical protein
MRGTHSLGTAARTALSPHTSRAALCTPARLAACVLLALAGVARASEQPAADQPVPAQSPASQPAPAQPAPAPPAARPPAQPAARPARPATPAQPAPAPALPRPDETRVTQEAIDAAITQGVAHLLSIQSTLEEGKPNAEWPYEGVYRVRGGIPEGYRVGGTAICALALIEAPGFADDAPRKDAVNRALDFVCAATTVPLLSPDTYDGGYDVRQWAYIYAIEFLARMKSAHGFPADRAKACEDAITWYLSALQSTEIPEAGGWNYARRGPREQPSAPSSFMTGTALQALFEAKKAGYEVDPAIVDRAVAFLERTRFASGAVAYSGEAGERQTTGGATPGAVGRMLVVESTLVLAGKGSTRDVRGALDAFIAHWDWLRVRKQQTGTHVAPFGVAPYYFMFAHRYAAQAVELLPQAERPEYRRCITNLLFSVREENGSWNDRVFPRSSGYGTAMAMLALMDPASPPPARWE